MNNDEKFYNSTDYPTQKQKRKMWNTIEQGIKPKKKFIVRINDMPSFYYGIAASFIILFCSIGVYTTAKQIIYNSKPEEIKLNTAYQSAIKEFEKVMPSVVATNGQTSNIGQYINAKKEQLNFIDAAIDELKRETSNSGITQMKQMRLRQLYNAKLKVLQEIIDKGDVEL